MNNDEKKAKKFLEKQHSNIQYEPIENSTPDFLVEENIAVEVRRLNKNYFNNQNIEGFEQIDIPLHLIIQEVLKSYDENFKGVTYFITLFYKRPQNTSFRRIKTKIKESLNHFLKYRPTTPFKINIDSNIAIEIAKKNEPIEDKLFQLAGSFDDDTGGSVGSIFLKNINFCLTEKSKKIENVKNEYNEWWLILVNHIYYLGLDTYHRKEVLRNKTPLRNFDKLLILHPKSLKVSFSKQRTYS